MQNASKLTQTHHSFVRHLLPVAVACICMIFVSACDGESENETIPEDNNSEQTGPEQNGTEPDNHGDNQLPNTVRFTDSAENLWPPQPKDITNVQAVGTQPREKANPANTQVRESAAAQPNSNSIFNNNNVVEAVGDHYAVLATYELKDKAGNNSTEIEIFNYTDNLLVTVSIKADGKITTKTAAAYEYQPAESQVEVQQAITLARTALSANGYLDHERLIGTGLLAHPTAAEIARSGKQFYSQRKIYVTFGMGGGAVPNYRALVNLSTEVVEQSGPIQ